MKHHSRIKTNIQNLSKIKDWRHSLSSESAGDFIYVDIDKFREIKKKSSLKQTVKPITTFYTSSKVRIRSLNENRFILEQKAVLSSYFFFFNRYTKKTFETKLTAELIRLHASLFKEPTLSFCKLDSDENWFYNKLDSFFM